MKVEVKVVEEGDGEDAVVGEGSAIMEGVTHGSTLILLPQSLSPMRISTSRKACPNLTRTRSKM